MASKQSPIQKALDYAKKSGFDPNKRASAEREYTKLKKSTDFLKVNNKEKFEEFKSLSSNATKGTFQSKITDPANHLYSILSLFGEKVVKENVWSSYSLLMSCHEFKIKYQTEREAGKSQNTHVSSGGPGVAGRFPSTPRSSHQSTIQKNNPKSSDWKHMQDRYEEQIQILNKEINILKSETADQRNQLKEKEKSIEELTTRLSRIASQQLTQGNPNITDLSDGNRPTKLGERFSQVYDDQWSEAFEALKEKGKQEENIVTELLRIVQDIYGFMQKSVKELMQKLASKTSEVIMCPFQSTSLQPVSDRGLPLNETDGFVRVLVKTQGHQALKPVQEKFKEKNTTRYGEDKRIAKYVDILLELIWYMVIQDPPMVLKFIRKGDKMEKEGLFKPYSKTGVVAEECVWPALLLHEGGPIIARGFALPR